MCLCQPGCSVPLELPRGSRLHPVMQPLLLVCFQLLPKAIGFAWKVSFFEVRPESLSRVLMVAGQATAPGVGDGPEAADARGSPRLFDLIRVSDNALRPAFFYALRNTLVAKDVDQVDFGQTALHLPGLPQSSESGTHQWPNPCCCLSLHVSYSISESTSSAPSMLEAQKVLLAFLCRAQGLHTVMTSASGAW